MTATTQPSASWKRGGFSLHGAVSALLQSVKKQAGGADAALRIEERLSLGPKKMLFLVDCDGHRFLVATGADTIVSMTELRPAEKRRKVEKA